MVHILPLSLALLCLFALSQDVCATPHRSPLLHKTVALSRKRIQGRAPYDIDELKRQKLALEAKYGIGHAKNQRRASGMNL